ncbi:hypothetical protein TI39_contig840g00008 [Zymoseptoria brevis]|uniref:RRM domain-containing protein n=1 Tax=Zymoseptoria brevis TaxID=1047168 RepID=A0A0F4GGE5_9PEZI|nr:hypothetical protein TI39_contig840g00008 [Zymoseptoria brevis]
MSGYQDISALLDAGEARARAQTNGEDIKDAVSSPAIKGDTEMTDAKDDINTAAPEDSKSHQANSHRPGSGRGSSPHDRHRQSDSFRPGSRDDRTSANRYLSEREENDERRARRSKGVEDEEGKPAKAGSDKDSANGSTRSARRSRSPRRDDYTRRVRSRDRGPDSYRGDGGRLRMVDDSYRPGRDGGGHRGGDRRDRDYDRDARDRSSRYDDEPRHGRGGGRDGGRDRRDNRDNRRGRGATPPELDQEERDKRTVFVQQLAAALRTKQLKAFFEQSGPVVEAQIVKDRVSGRSKGVGYVEFADEESVQKALELTGQKLMNIPIIVQLTEAEKNRQARTSEGQPTQSNGIPFHRLYVGNIHFSIEESDLRDVFEPFGELEFVQLQKEDTGRSKGYGFVQFAKSDEAKIALEKMNGFEVAGRPIRVGLGSDKFTPETTSVLLQRFGSQAHHAQMQGSSFSGAGGRGAHAGGQNNFDRSTNAREHDKSGASGALDDTDVGGVAFNNYSRHALMSKLARTDEPQPVVETKVALPQRVVVDEPNPSRCVLIKNVYNHSKETEESLADLKVDMREECDKKYGSVVHLDTASGSTGGEVYVKFAAKDGGIKAVQGLNGRFFGGRRLTASYVADAFYHTMWPKAKGL